jgi:hypothetical protein
MGDRADGWRVQSGNRNGPAVSLRDAWYCAAMASRTAAVLFGIMAVAVANTAAGQTLRLPADDDFVRRAGIMVPNQPHRLRERSEGAGPRLYSPLDSGSVVSRRAWLAAGELSSTPEVKRVRLVELDALMRQTLLPSDHLQRLVRPTRNVRVLDRHDRASDGEQPGVPDEMKSEASSEKGLSDELPAAADATRSWRTSLIRPAGYGSTPAYDYLLAMSSPELRSRPAPDLDVCRQALAAGRQQANLGRWSAAEVYYTEAWLHLPQSDRLRIFSQLVGR